MALFFSIIQMNLKNDLFLRAANGEAVERTPVWLMRQAGRILPEYRAVRSKLGSFKNLVEHPEAAAEVTLQPVDLLGVDAAIIFSDILVIPEAMGLPYEVIEKSGPYFENTIETITDIQALNIANPNEDLSYVLEAITLVKNELNGRVPLIGFAGAPFTIFCYMIEGKGSKTFSKAKSFMYTQPEATHMLLEKITTSTINYLKAQVEAGADLLQIFDSWAGILSPEAYRIFAIPYIEKIVNALKNVPVTVFAKGAWFALPEISKMNCRVIGLDWNMDPIESRAIIGNDKTLQGNLDPSILYGDFDFIRKETHKMLNAFGPSKHIANLGHGVYPDIDPDKVRCFIDTVKEFKHRN